MDKEGYQIGLVHYIIEIKVFFFIIMKEMNTELLNVCVFSFNKCI